MADEMPKIEPTLEPKNDAATPIIDSPSIAAIDQAAPEATRIEPKAEPEVARIEAVKVEKVEATSLPPAGQLDAPKSASTNAPIKNAVVPYRRPEPKAAATAPQQTSRSTRFALLAACVAIAASFGAVGGSLAVAKFGPMINPPVPAPVVAVTKDNVADEVKALKDTVAQLRGTTKSLSDNLAALKTSVNTSNTAQNTQIGKIAETLDRVEKSQGEQRKTAAAAAAATTAASTHVAATTRATNPDITGSTAPRPMTTTEPNGALKNSVVQGWVLRRVYDGAALIEGRDGIVEVEPGTVTPGLGRVESIRRQDGRWVVMTSRGMVVGR